MIHDEDIHRQLEETPLPYIFDSNYTRYALAAAKRQTRRQKGNLVKMKRGLWGRLSTVELEENEKARVIYFNDSNANRQYPSNIVRTAKYTWLNAFPKFLFEQFSRFANLYFLGIGILFLVDAVTPTLTASRYGQIISLTIIISITAVKEAYEDFWRHREDYRLNRSSVQCLGPQGTCRWGDLRVGDLVRLHDQEFLPADIVLLCSSADDGLVYVETKQLDGETNLKVKIAPGYLQSRFREESDAINTVGTLECDPPNDRIYEFAGAVKLEGGGSPRLDDSRTEIQDGDAVAVGLEQFLPRGCKLRNTDWIHGIVVNTGHDTKIQQNNKKKPKKRSTLEKKLDILLGFTFTAQILVVLLIVGFAAGTCYRSEGRGEFIWYLAPGSTNCEPVSFLYLFFTYIITTSNFVPLALYVSMEITRLLQSLFMMVDNKFYDPERDLRLMVRTSNLNEECGMVSYLFSDKTGTLTSNKMVFSKYVIDGTVYEEKSAEENSDTLENLKKDLETINRLEEGGGNGRPNVEFFRLLAMCNSVVIEDGAYVGTSPDEVALVGACKEMGYVFEKRTNKDMTINIHGNIEKWELLGVLEFNSSRKRMSVIVRSPSDGRIRLYCKGADFVIFKLLRQDQYAEAEKLRTILDQFAATGLRTLCMCYREIELEDFKKWYQEFSATQTMTEGRAEALEEVASRIEMDMKLLGATAIEDALQEEVPETLLALEHAGVKTWILTGDKQETAINIGVSCGLLNDVMNVVVINEDSPEDVEAQMDRAIGVWRAMTETMGRGPSHFGLVIDGHTLQFVLKTELEKKLVLLGRMCKTVLACRVAPKQKTELVEAVRSWDGKKVTMAIGDGANDVGMIQAAHVGVGIIGAEGVEAKLASDFAFTRFRFLQRLMLVHGRWNYLRMSRMALFVMYKSAAIALLEVYFAFFNDYSGSIFVDPMVSGFYNVFLTAVMPVVFAVYDRDLSADYALMFPEVYKRGQTKSSVSIASFLWWFGNAILHSAVAFFVPMLTDAESPVENGRLIGLFGYSSVVFLILLTSVNLMLGIYARSWNAYTFCAWFFFTSFWFYGGFIFSSKPLAFDAGLNPYYLGTYSEILSQPTTWLLLLSCCVLCITPVVVKKFVQRQYMPHEKTLVQELMAARVTREDIFPKTIVPQAEAPLHVPVIDRRGVEYQLRQMVTFDFDDYGGGLHDRYNPVIGIMNRHRRMKRTLSDSNLEHIIFTNHVNIEEKKATKHRRNITVGF